MPSIFPRTLRELIVRRRFLIVIDAVTPSGTGLNSRVAACFFSVSKSWPADWKSACAASRVIQPSTLGRDMLTTSLSQDLYKRFASPQATDRQVLRVSRWTSVAAAGIAFAMAVVLGSVVNALTIFYTLLTVVLFVPIVGGLFVPRTDSRAALASIVMGVIAMLTAQVATGGRGWSFVTPALAGLVAAIAAWLVMIRASPGDQLT